MKTRSDDAVRPRFLRVHLMGQRDGVDLRVAQDDGIAVVRQADEASHLAVIGQIHVVGVEALAVDLAGVEVILREGEDTARVDGRANTGRGQRVTAIQRGGEHAQLGDGLERGGLGRRGQQELVAPRSGTAWSMYFQP